MQRSIFSKLHLIVDTSKQRGCKLTATEIEHALQYCNSTATKCGINKILFHTTPDLCGYFTNIWSHYKRELQVRNIFKSNLNKTKTNQFINRHLRYSFWTATTSGPQES